MRNAHGDPSMPKPQLGLQDDQALRAKITELENCLNSIVDTYNATTFAYTAGLAAEEMVQIAQDGLKRLNTPKKPRSTSSYLPGTPKLCVDCAYHEVEINHGLSEHVCHAHTSIVTGKIDPMPCKDARTTEACGPNGTLWVKRAILEKKKTRP